MSTHAPAVTKEFFMLSRGATRDEIPAIFPFEGGQGDVPFVDKTAPTDRDTPHRLTPAAPLKGGFSAQTVARGTGILSVILPLLRLAVFLTLGLGILLPGRALAQGEGPKTYQPAPDGTNVFVVTYMNLSTNMNFNQSAALRDANININLVVPTYKHFFSVGGHLAEFVVSPIMGTLDGSVAVANREINVPRKTGFFDSYVGVRVGLYGAPALKLPEFVKHKQGLQIYGIFGT